MKKISAIYMIIFAAAVISCFASGKIISSGSIYFNDYQYFNNTWVGLFQQQGATAQPAQDTLLASADATDGNYYLSYSFESDLSNLYIAAIEGNSPTIANNAAFALLKENAQDYIFGVTYSNMYPSIHIIEDESWINLQKETFSENWYIY